LTVDDLPVISTRHDTVTQWSTTRGILYALHAVDAPAIGFVNEDKLGAGAARDARTRMLRAWLDAGHDLGNHSYSHPDLNTTPIADYTAAIVQGEEVTTELRGSPPNYFRHPFLHAGNDSAKKAGLERFLADRGYRVAPVTIDNGDWIFARAYDLALDAADSVLARRIADAYGTYMDTVFGFYEAQSRAIVGHEIPQVLLLHANRINADRLDELLAMMRRRGYRFITLDEALRDTAYDRADAYVGPAGITWLHRWAITDGVDRSIFRGEPEVPAFVDEAAR
jgi:peptidoglycan/xylan/chitin deacetylase (PgdA/CDA1 family)